MVKNKVRVQINGKVGAFLKKVEALAEEAVSIDMRKELGEDNHAALVVMEILRHDLIKAVEHYEGIVKDKD